MFIVDNFNNITKLDDTTMSQRTLLLANQQLAIPSTSGTQTAEGQRKKRKRDDIPLDSSDEIPVKKPQKSSQEK